MLLLRIIFLEESEAGVRDYISAILVEVLLLF